MAHYEKEFKYPLYRIIEDLVNEGKGFRTNYYLLTLHFNPTVWHKQWTYLYVTYDGYPVKDRKDARVFETFDEVASWITSNGPGPE